MKTKALSLLLLSLFIVTGCGESTVEDPEEENEEEVITTVQLKFSGGADVTATFRDADGDGGEAPTIDDITLPANETFVLDIALLNELVDPSDDEYNIGNEVKEEAEEHQLFFTGTIFDAGATFAYADKESDYTDNNVGDDLPVGLKNTITTGDPGTGTMIVTLKHQPPVNDTDTKTATSTSADGDTDFEITFNVTVE